MKQGKQRRDMFVSTSKVNKDSSTIQDTLQTS